MHLFAISYPALTAFETSQDGESIVAKGGTIDEEGDSPYADGERDRSSE
jgi:hypothetical protein